MDVPTLRRPAGGPFALAKVVALTLAVLAGGAPVAMAQTALEAGDVVAGPGAHGAGIRLITDKGSVGFSVPADWSVLSVQSRPPVSVIGFQAPNPADEGTADSTNLAVTVYDLDSEAARTARLGVGRAFGPSQPVKTQSGAWTLYRQEADLGATTYTVLDGQREIADLNLAVSVRLAWPHLKANSPTYDQDMAVAYQRLLDSVSPAKGPYTLGPGEAVRRPAASH